jgi:cytochrome c
MARQIGDGQDSGGNAPWRWLLVVVPLAILMATSVYLLGIWSTRWQEAQRRQEPPPVARDDSRRDVPSGTSRDLEPRALPPERHLNGSGRGEPAAFDADAIVDLVASGNAERGAQLFRMCGACHTADKDGEHRVGPNLWNIVGRDKAADPRFRYSQALRDRGGTWTYAALASYLNDPRAFAPGTSMTFRGIADEKRLVDVMAYLRTLSDDPAPLP